MAGAHRIEPQRQRTVEYCGELHPLVAPDARVRGAAGGVLRDEVIDDIRTEPFRDVPHVERHTEHVGGTTRIT